MNLELEILKKSDLDEAKGRKKVKTVIPLALKHTECHRGKAFNWGLQDKCSGQSQGSIKTKKWKGTFQEIMDMRELALIWVQTTIKQKGGNLDTEYF